MMKQVIQGVCFASLIAFGACALPGCGSDEPASVVDSTDLDAIAEYERMIAEEEKAANEEMEAAE
jgi:hypothetical protein